MAFASFFDKSALAASAVLQGFDLDRYKAVLEAHHVVLCLDSAAVESFEGRTTLTLATNLLSRLYPTLILRAIGVAAVEFQSELTSLAKAINPAIDVVTDAPGEKVDCSIALVVGDTPAGAFAVEQTAPIVYVGSLAWDALVSSSHIVGSGLSRVPFGAAASACIGVANVFRHCFAAQLQHPDLDRELSFSTDTLEVRHEIQRRTEGATSGLLDLGFSDVDAGEIVLVGAGAVGEGCIWTLARAAGLQGTLHVVDSQTLDDTNPQRYVLTTPEDIDRPKTSLAAEALAVDALGSGGRASTSPSPLNPVRRVRAEERAALNVVRHEKTWGGFLAARPRPWRLARVLVALDSARDRISVQCALPKWVANAWTQPGDLGLSRHAAIGNTSCLGCLYIPMTPAAKNEDVLIAEAVGLAGNVMLVRQLLATGSGVGEEVLRVMAGELGVPAEPLSRFVGQPLRTFYSHAVCGGLVLKLQAEAQARALLDGDSREGGHQNSNGSPNDRAAMVPMAFQSALAGVLLAAALVADAASLAAPPPGKKAVIDVLRPLAAQLLVPVAPHSSGKCICQDPDFNAAFVAQWGAGEMGGELGTGVGSTPVLEEAVAVLAR